MLSPNRGLPHGFLYPIGNKQSEGFAFSCLHRWCFFLLLFLMWYSCAASFLVHISVYMCVHVHACVHVYMWWWLGGGGRGTTPDWIPLFLSPANGVSNALPLAWHTSLYNSNTFHTDWQRDSKCIIPILFTHRYQQVFSQILLCLPNFLFIVFSTFTSLQINKQT